jgi:hypothetical protein
MFNVITHYRDDSYTVIASIGFWTRGNLEE